MKIVVGDVWSKILTKDTRVLGIIRQTCSARPEGFMFMPKYRAGHWDGYISLMRGINVFPSGLVHLVVAALEEREYVVELEHEFEIIERHRWVTEDSLIGITLRDYQVDAANLLIENVRGIAKMATNSGKTEVMAAIARILNVPTVVLLHRKELLHQTTDRFYDRVHESIGRIGDGVFELGMITVAMIQSLANRKDIEDIFADTMLVMVDECHHASSGQMMDILYKIPGTYRYGFSGTPLKQDRLSDLKLIAVTGPVVVDVGNEYLIEEGYSATPNITFYESDGEYYDMRYQEAYSEAIVKNKHRNDVIHTIVDSYVDKQILILVNRVEHGKILEKLLSDYDAVFLHGGQSTETRQNRIDYMKSHDFGVTIASPIFDEGVDIPNIDVVVMAGGGKSNVKLLQRIGRGMRKKTGDNVLHIFDFIDTGNDYLLNHSEKRLDVYEQEGFDITLG